MKDINFRSRLQNSFSDFKGVVYAPSVVYRLGDYMAKGTKRRALTVGAVVGTTLLVKAIPSGDYGLIWDSIKQTGGATTALCLASFVGGTLLRSSAQGFMDKESLAEEASGANLTENLKKKHVYEHSQQLWERVWKHQQKYFSDHEINRISREIQENDSELLQLINPVVEARDIEIENKDYLFKLLKEGIVTNEGFRNVFDYCHLRPLNQRLQNNLAGIKIGLIEDWYDGGLLHKTGNKTFEVWNANPEIQTIKNLTGWKSKNDFKKIIKGGRNYERWYNWITTAISYRRAKEGKRLQEGYGVSLSLEDFLERNEDLDKEVFNAVKKTNGRARAEQAVCDLHRSQRFVLGASLHYGYDDAMKKLDKALLPIFLNGTGLRARIDLPYVTGSLNGQSLQKDLEKQNSLDYYSNKINLTTQIEEAKQLEERIPQIIDDLGFSDIDPKSYDAVQFAL